MAGNWRVRLSGRIIFGLLAVAVLSWANTGQEVPDGYHLTFGRAARLVIRDWWGRAAGFPAIAALEPVRLVALDFTEQLKELQGGPANPS